MKFQNLKDDKGSSNSPSSSKRTSLRISTVTINSDTAAPAPVYFTTTMNDPPMPLRRNSVRSITRYFQKNLINLNSPLDTNYEEIKHLNSESSESSESTEGNWSLLDNLSLYDKIFDNNTL